MHGPKELKGNLSRKTNWENRVLWGDVCTVPTKRGEGN